MIDTLLSKPAPHLCCGCGKIGSLLCDNCKYNIIESASMPCISCGVPTLETCVCRHCDVACERAWCVGECSGVLQRLVGDFKFQNMYGASRPLSDLLIDSIDQLPGNMIIVPIPTVAGYIRERGYDHVRLLTNQVARHHRVRMKQALRRVFHPRRSAVQTEHSVLSRLKRHLKL